MTAIRVLGVLFFVVLSSAWSFPAEAQQDTDKASYEVLSYQASMRLKSSGIALVPDETGQQFIVDPHTVVAMVDELGGIEKARERMLELVGECDRLERMVLQERYGNSQWAEQQSADLVQILRRTNNLIYFATLTAAVRRLGENEVEHARKWVNDAAKKRAGLSNAD